jgi:hypothetical protein
MKPRIPSSVVSPPLERSGWQGYAFAVLMLVAALLGRRLLDPYARDAAPLATMYVAVAFAVWFGGWRPAAAITLVGFVCAVWWFVPPRYTYKSWHTI